MTKKEDTGWEQDLEDILIGRPKAFSLRNRHYLIYPLTYGKIILVGRLLRKMSIEPSLLKMSPTLELLRVTREHKAEVARIIAYATCKDKEELFSEGKIKERISFFLSHMDEDDMVSLFCLITGSLEIEKIKKHYGIDKEQRRLSSVVSRKDKGGSASFGGKTVYGALLDVCGERYGWTPSQVLWEIPFITVQLMLADKITTVYLTEKERKRCGGLVEGERISGDDREAVERMIRSQSWK